MITQSQATYQEYLKTDYWAEVSRRVKNRGGYRCQVCNSPLDLVAHHRTYEHRGDELNHLDDLICMCGRCHKLFHKEVAEHGAAEVKPVIPGPQIVLQTHGNMTKAGRRQMVKLARELANVQVAAQKQQQPSGSIISGKGPKVIPHTQEDIERDMPSGDTIVLTLELVNRLRTNGAFCNAALVPLGMTHDKMQAGWPQRLVGTEVSRGVYRACLEGRYHYNVKMPRS